MALEEREVRREVGRLIRGSVSGAAVKRIAAAEGFESFAELCLARLPEEVSRIKIGPKDLLRALDRWRRSEVGRTELWSWADELYNIATNHRIGYEARAEELVTAALSAVSIVSNDRLFRSVPKTARALEYIRACLLRRRKLRLRHIFTRIFEDLDLAHLANKHRAEAGDSGEAPRFADVVLLDRPFRRGLDIYAECAWMIAFTVTARSLYEEERAEDAVADLDLPGGEGGGEWICPDCARERRAEGGGARPEDEPGATAPAGFEVPGWREAEDDGEGAPDDEGGEPPARIRPTPRPEGELDRIPALRRLVPNFRFERWRPRYFLDGDGIAEIVLEAETIGPAEVEYATRLFCIQNRIRSAWLDGRRLKALVVKPGAGRRAPAG